jgi:penicillin-insensitive murein endopeptidase
VGGTEDAPHADKKTIETAIARMSRRCRKFGVSSSACFTEVMRSWFWLVLAALLGVAAVAEASPPRRAARAAAREREARAERQQQRERARLARLSQSIGAPWQGRLQHGVELRPSSTVRRTTEYAAAGHFFGTFEMVQLLERAAAGVARAFPGAKLSVGEISRRNGGDIDGHGSHENGRDVDIAFYMLDGAGNSYAPFAFAHFDHRGRGTGTNEGLRFDDARNWELVSRLVTDPDARVQYIFVARSLRERLLAEGRRRRASNRSLDRAAAVLVQPAAGHPHRNHFHVRIYCDPGDRPRCVDREPFHAWYPR